MLPAGILLSGESAMETLNEKQANAGAKAAGVLTQNVQAVTQYAGEE